MNEVSGTVDDLFLMLGKLHFENEMLKAERLRLVAKLQEYMAEDNDKQPGLHILED